jgi:hydroxypyruvate isomerase
MARIRFSASVSLMFREYPLLDRFGAARAAGFKAVEIQTLDEGDPSAMADAAAQAGVEVVLVNVGMADFRHGGPGLSGVPGRQDWFDSALDCALEAARLLGAKLVHLGPSRVPNGTSRTASLEAYRRNLTAAVNKAAGTDVQLLIEPLNVKDTPDVLLSDLSLAAALIDEVGDGRLGLQFDIYHTAMNDVDPVEAFTAHRKVIRHVQFSDAPGRHEPGTGDLDFERIFSHIAATGYRGWVGAEYHPSRPTTETLGWLESLGERIGP